MRYVGGLWRDHGKNKNFAQDELESLVPSSTISIGDKGTTASSQTQLHARALRGFLESLDEIKHHRRQLVARTQRLADVDNIKSSIIAAASNFERSAELTPAMFVDVSDGELAKYHKFIQGLAEGQRKQEGLLEAIKVCYDHVAHNNCSDTCLRSLPTSNSYHPGRRTQESKIARSSCTTWTWRMPNTARSRATWMKGVRYGVPFIPACMLTAGVCLR